MLSLETVLKELFRKCVYFVTYCCCLFIGRVCWFTFIFSFDAIYKRICSIIIIIITLQLRSHH